MVLAMVELSSSLLDALWKEWREKHGYHSVRAPSYLYASRRSRLESKFEDWLYSHGLTVKQKNKKRYLEYHGNSRQLTIFLLKYGIK